MGDEDNVYTIAEWMQESTMSKKTQAEMIKYLKEVYDSKSRGWEYETSDIDYEEDKWADFDSDDEEDLEDDFEFAAVATLLMDELTANNLDSHILLKYPKIADWWGSVLRERKRKEEAKRKREEAKRKREEDERARELLLSRLSPEERRLLGIK
jgi:hypothetical protein